MGRHVVVNARFLAQTPTGIHRYAKEVCDRLTTPVRMARPRRGGRGWRGHLWEQTSLLREARGALLWNPSATGPVLHRPHVTTVHDLGPFERPDLFAPAYVRLHQAVVGRLARTAACVLTVSPEMAQRIADRFGRSPDEVRVVPPGVAPAKAASPAALRAGLSAWGLEPGRYFLFVGTREPRKNLGLLLDAWAGLPERTRREFPLVLAGPGRNPNVARGGDLAPPPGALVLPHLDDARLRLLYQGARLLLFPSLYEGFGIPVLEAAQAGTPVVASTQVPAAGLVPGVPRLGPTQVQPWRAAMAEAAEAAVPAARRRSLRAAVRPFTWEAAAAQMDDVFTDFA